MKEIRLIVVPAWALLGPLLVCVAAAAWSSNKAGEAYRRLGEIEGRAISCVQKAAACDEHLTACVGSQARFNDRIERLLSTGF